MLPLWYIWSLHFMFCLEIVLLEEYRPIMHCEIWWLPCHSYPSRKRFSRKRGSLCLISCQRRLILEGLMSLNVSTSFTVSIYLGISVETECLTHYSVYKMITSYWNRLLYFLNHDFCFIAYQNITKILKKHFILVGYSDMFFQSRALYKQPSSYFLLVFKIYPYVKKCYRAMRPT